MWTSPIYRLKRPAALDRRGKRSYEEVAIDVTQSAPSFATPGDTLARTLTAAIRTAGLRRGELVVDFGAGKLRNTLYLLKKGYRVCPVEFEQLFERSHQADLSLQQAKKYAGFSRLVPPHRFIASTQFIGLVLLVNVINIMPVALERLLALDYCHRQLRPDGHLLWYTQRGIDCSGHPASRCRISDGVLAGMNRAFKTFYRDYSASEIDSLLAGAGFELVSSIPAAHNHARLYRRLDTSPMSSVQSPSRLHVAQALAQGIPATPRDKPKTATVPIDRIDGDPRSIPAGKRFANAYQRHVKHMLEILFSPQELRFFQAEVGVFGGVKRVDILASNKSRSGFFYSLKADQDIRCPTIVIECKNYQSPLANPEVDQLGSRLGKKLGMVGLLAFRAASDTPAIIRRCQAFYNNEQKVIIPLSDEDFVVLLELKKALKEQDIERFLDQRLLTITSG